LVIGGGEVAERKVLSLLEAGARVRVISPQITERIQQLANEKEIVFIEREYRSGDLDKTFLVISATDSPVINAAIATEADRLNILLNVVDSPAECNFIVPASVIRGNLLISVSTSGKSPAFAKKIRQQIEQRYGFEYGPLLEILGCCRKFILEQVSDIEVRKQIFGQLAESIFKFWKLSAAYLKRMISLIQSLKRKSAKLYLALVEIMVWEIYNDIYSVSSGHRREV
jgi:precorrin-2 dehydrogenase/sirohydrochlorin ferrochelatase